MATLTALHNRYEGLCAQETRNPQEELVVTEASLALNRFRGAILRKPPRTLGDLLAKALAAAAYYPTNIDGHWDQLEDRDEGMEPYGDPGAEVALAVLQLAGVTDGVRERGNMPNNAAAVAATHKHELEPMRRDPVRFPDLTRLAGAVFTTDWTLPPEVDQYVEMFEAAINDPNGDGDTEFRPLDPIWDRIFNTTPRRLGDVLARAIILDLHMRDRAGKWDDGTDWSNSVVLGLLQLAGLTDGKLQRGEAADAG